MEQTSFLTAIKWAYTSNVGEKALGALFMIVLAALLGPHDFGVVAVASTYILFLQMFLDQGLMSAVIQRKHLDREHLDAVFWVNLALSLALVLASIMCSRWWAKVNHAPEVAGVISVLSLCIPIEGLAIVQRALLVRGMQFRSLAIRSNVAALASGIVGIGMAQMKFGVWALVAAQVARDITALILLWRLSAWRPTVAFSLSHLKDLLKFSVGNFIARLANYADGQIGSVLLGVFFGPTAVGLFRLADRIVSCVVVMATSSIQSVSLPEFSRRQDEPEKLRQSVLLCMRLSCTATLPALAGLAAISRTLMNTLGGKWSAASAVLSVLSVLGMSTVFIYFTGPLMQALGRMSQVAALEWLRTALGIASLVVAGLLVRDGSVTRQIMGIALGRLFPGLLVVAPAFLCILMRLCGISFRALALTALPSLAASAVVVITVVSLNQSGLFGGDRPSYVLGAEVLFGGLAGSVSAVLFDKQLRQKLKKLVAKALHAPTQLSKAEAAELGNIISAGTQDGLS